MDRSPWRLKHIQNNADELSLTVVFSLDAKTLDEALAELEDLKKDCELETTASIRAGSALPDIRYSSFRVAQIISILPDP